jgi:O-acetyl-ADP-ribose deacetylase (regulator of RNase III)
MMEYKKGDLLAEDADALVNTVNCVGSMGRGIALQFKKAWPESFQAYAAACKREEVRPGRMFVFETGALTPPRYIINFPTKRHWRGKSRMEDIESGLEALVEEIRHRGIRSIAIPPLGAGLGGLDWDARYGLASNAPCGNCLTSRSSCSSPTGSRRASEAAAPEAAAPGGRRRRSTTFSRAGSTDPSRASQGLRSATARGRTSPFEAAQHIE